MQMTFFVVSSFVVQFLTADLARALRDILLDRALMTRLRAAIREAGERGSRDSTPPRCDS